MPTRSTLLLPALLLLFFCGCGGEDPGPRPADAPPREPQTDPEAEPSPLQVTDDGIRNADGAVLLRIEELGGSIEVEPGSTFGAADRFTGAELAPGGAWFAVTTTGAAHAAAWLVDAVTGAPFPAAFQYGGDLEAGPWSDDGRHLVFVHRGPAGDRTLSVASRDRVGSTVAEAGQPVRVPEHDDLPPGERDYRVQGWSEGRLLFTLGDRSWSFDPEGGEVAPTG